MSRIVEIARGELGVREATQRNDGLPSVRYMGGREEPWCGHFVAWCARQAGTPLPRDTPARAGAGGENPIASVAFLERTMQRAGRWRARASSAVPSYTPRPGDLVFFVDRAGSDRGRGPEQRHVAIVESADETLVHTIEGNIGHAVVRRVHRRDDPRITGYGTQTADVGGVR